MRYGSVQRRKPNGTQRFGCMKDLKVNESTGCAEAGSSGSSCDACRSLASKRAKGEKGTSVEEKKPVPRLMEGWEEDFAGLYILLTTVS